MKKLVYILFGLLVIGGTSCVDDFEDANPSRPLDGPAATEAVASTDVVVSGGTVDISVTVVDAPAGLDSASVRATDALGVDRGGTAVLTSGQGITEGTAVVTYTAQNTTGNSGGGLAEGHAATVFSGINDVVGNGFRRARRICEFRSVDDLRETKEGTGAVDRDQIETTHYQRAHRQVPPTL